MPQLTFNSGRRESHHDEDGIETVAKDSDETQSYTLDWSQDLATSETISASSWEVSGPTKVSSSSTSTTTTVKLSGSGGTAKNTVTTSASRVLVHRIRVLTVVA